METLFGADDLQHSVVVVRMDGGIEVGAQSSSSAVHPSRFSGHTSNPSSGGSNSTCRTPWIR